MMLSNAKNLICPSCSCRIWLNMRRQPAGEMKGIRPSNIRTRAHAIQKVSLFTTFSVWPVAAYFLAGAAAGALPLKDLKNSDDEGSSTITSLFLLKLVL